jgi:hypothetical protein
VTVHFERTRLSNDPQIEHLYLSNDPFDDNYDLLHDVEGVLNNGQVVRIGSDRIDWDGQPTY